MRGRSVDAGGPLLVSAPDGDDNDDGDDAVSVDARFDTLDVERRSVILVVRGAARDDDDGSLYATTEEARLLCLLDNGACTADDDAAAAFLADHPWFEERVLSHMDHVRQRAWRAVAQRDRETAARRTLATATPGKMIAFHDLFPAYWDLLFTHDDALYWVVDQYCPNPACDCSSVALNLYHLRKGNPPPLLTGQAQVELASERSLLEVSFPNARDLFSAFWAEHQPMPSSSPRRRATRCPSPRIAAPQARASRANRPRASTAQCAIPVRLGGLVHRFAQSRLMKCAAPERRG